MRDGLALANSLGFNRVEEESDSLQVINFCSGQTRWWDSAAAIFAECLDISSLIGKVIYKHCPRSCNQAAHVLANFGFCSKSSFSPPRECSSMARPARPWIMRVDYARVTPYRRCYSSSSSTSLTPWCNTPPAVAYFRGSRRGMRLPASRSLRTML